MNTNHTRVSRRSMLAIAVGLFAVLAPGLSAEDVHGRRFCSVASLDGSYGFYRTGKGGFGGPVAGQGIATFDGEGNWEGVVSNSRDGEISLDEEFAGTYTVAPNCTGALLIDGEEIERLVIVDDGRGYYALNLGEGVTVYLVATRIHDR